MHKLKSIMEKLEEAAYCELCGDLKSVNTCELGEVVDMIKDCCEAMYYYKVFEAMEEKEGNIYSDLLPMMLSGNAYFGLNYPDKMFYPEQSNVSGQMQHSNAYKHYMDTIKKYPVSDMEHKQERMQAMEEYTKDLHKSMSDLLEDISPEEKQMLRQKLLKIAGTMQ